MIYWKYSASIQLSEYISSENTKRVSKISRFGLLPGCWRFWPHHGLDAWFDEEILQVRRLSSFVHLFFHGFDCDSHRCSKPNGSLVWYVKIHPESCSLAYRHVRSSLECQDWTHSYFNGFSQPSITKEHRFDWDSWTGEPHQPGAELRSSRNQSWLLSLS